MRQRIIPNLTPFGNVKPAFQLFTGTNSGLKDLSSDLTINSTTVSPSMRYEGKDAGLATWTATVGSDLPIAGSGTAPTLGKGTPLNNSVDQAVHFNAGKYYQAANTTSGNVGTDDFIVEMLVRYTDSGTGSGETIIGKYNGIGWDTFFNAQSVGDIGMYVGDGVHNVTISADLTSQPSVWYHVIFFVDVSETLANGTAVFVNGQFVANGTGDPVTTTINNTTKLTMAAQSDGSLANNGSTAYVAQYHAANWFAGGSQNAIDWSVFAADRFARLTGTQAKDCTTTATRNSPASFQKNDGGLYLVGKNWPRSNAADRDTNGSTVLGYLSETVATNLFKGSNDFTNATYWDQNGTIGVTADAYVSPSGDQNAALVNMGTAANLAQAISGLSTATEYTFSIWAKLVGAEEMPDDTHLSLYAFDFTTATETLHQNIQLTPDLQRYSGTFTAVSTTHINIGLVNEDGAALPFDCAIYGAQLELGTVASSYIPTTSTTATRAKDVLVLDGYFPQTGTIAASSIANTAEGGAAANVLLSLSDTTINNEILLYDDDGGNPFAIVVADGVRQLSISGGTAEAISHRQAFSFVDGYGTLYTDGVLQESEAYAELPTTTRLSIGCDAAGTQQPNAVVAKVKLYDNKKVPRG